MALAELCGLDEFNTFGKDDAFQTEVVSYSKNFMNNMDLALPPFANVSITFHNIIHFGNLFKQFLFAARGKLSTIHKR